MGYTIKTYHGSYNIVKRADSVKYILIHYVGSGTSKSGSARANCKYFAGGNRNSSAHYFIDDGTIYEYADPKKYATWHCGDGGGKYGITNGNSIGIEVCINGNKAFTDEEQKRLAWLVQRLQKQFGVPDSRVVRHYDASRKACPYYYTPSGKGGTKAFETLRKRVTGGSASSGSSSTRKPPAGRLDPKATIVLHDGDFGPVTVKYWQARLRKAGYYPASKYEIDGDFGYYTKLETQKFLQQKTSHYPKGKYKLDGDFAEHSIKALQSYLKDIKCYWDEGGWCLIDGDWGEWTTLAVQRAINAGVLFGKFNLRL